MKKLLVTSFSNNIKTKSLKIILGNWCYKKYDLSYKKNDTSYNLNLRKKKDCISRSIKIENKIIYTLTKILNNHHKVNYDKRQWKIILGHWIRIYTRVFTNRYLHLSKVLNKKNIDYFILTKNENSTNNNELIDFVKRIKNDNFNDEIYKKIIEFKKIEIKIISKKIKSKEIHSNSKNILNLLNKIFYKNNKIVLSELYLNKVDSILLHIKLGIFPKFWNQLNFNKYSNINYDLRKNLKEKIKFKKKNLYDFLISNIFDYMPKAYLEDFNNISSFVKKNFPTNPKTIVTANSFFFNETFKNFVASNYKKIKYVVYQHGNNYNSHFDEHYKSIEQETSHFFLSWFKTNNSKKYIETCMQKKISKTSSSNCLLILHWPFDQRDKIWDNFNEYSLYISRTKKLLKNICSIKIIKKVNYRVSHNHENIDNLVYFKKLSKKINIDFSKKTYLESINKSKLALFTYNSSGFYENLSNNIPSIMIIDKGYLFEIDKNTSQDFKILIKNNIIFTDIKKLRFFLNDNWNFLDQWWQSKKIQICINKFSENNAIKSSNVINKIVESINKLPKKLV